MVITEEQRTQMYPAATMETASATTEETYYANLPATRVDPPAGYPENTPDGNAKVAKVGAGTGLSKIGPSITLKVMAGERFHVTVNSWWNSGNTPGTPVSPLSDILAALAGSAAGVSGGKFTPAEITSSGALSPSITDFLSSQTVAGDKPKAYLNWILLDEQFKHVSSSSGFEQVGNANDYSTHTRADLAINKNGYLYIYVSNETPNIDVFFDNLTVTHVRGPMLEETHYYPFGLTMAGISSKALNGAPVNRKKFNGIEHTTEFDLNTYDAFFRNADPQTGRWWQIDPKPNLSESHYSMMSNNPVLNIDPLGDTIINGQKVEPQTPEAATYLENVTVTGKRIKAGLVNNPCTSCHIPKSYVNAAQEKWWYNMTKDLDKAHGQVMPPRPAIFDFFMDHREIEDPEYSEDDIDNLINNGGILEVGPDGYIIGPKPRVITGTPPAVGLRGRPPIPSLTQRAANLSKQIGKNSVTIKTVNGHIRYDLAGKAHGHVPTPHSLRYTRNIGPNGMINFSKPKFPAPMTQQDLRIIRNYLKSLQ